MFESLFSKKATDLTGSAFKGLFDSSENAVLLDVRSPGEFMGGTLPGARNLDVTAADFKSRVKNLNPQETYFVFCRSGNRSATAVALMEEGGLKAYNLVGGLSAWPKS